MRVTLETKSRGESRGYSGKDLHFMFVCPRGYSGTL